MADLLEIREVPADKVIQSKRLLKLLNVTGQSAIRESVSL